MSSLMNSFVSQSHKHQQGFTLLELVLVMLIIGLVASTPLVFIDNQDNQFRYEETLKKLELIERAVYLPQTYRGEPVLSGFVVDNGVLPPIPASSALQPLISKDSWNLSGSDDWADYALYDPFISIIAASTAQVSGYKQLKGYRAHYLKDGLDSSQEFLDAWGEPFAVTSSGASYTAAFQGTNPSHPAPTDYENAASAAVSSNEWAVQLNQIDLMLTNNASGASRSLALIVFENTATATEAERWTTYHFPVDPASGAIPTVGHSLSENWYQNGNLMSSASVAATSIPAGLHPVFVVETADQDDIQEYDRLLVIPGATQPSLQFEVD